MTREIKKRSFFRMNAFSGYIGRLPETMLVFILQSVGQDNDRTHASDFPEQPKIQDCYIFY